MSEMERVAAHHYRTPLDPPLAVPDRPAAPVIKSEGVRFLEAAMAARLRSLHSQCSMQWLELADYYEAEALRASSNGVTVMVTEEFKAKQFPSDDVDVRELRRVSLYDEAAKKRRSATINKMQLDRMKPRLAKERDLVPDYIRERYTELWQAEDRRLLAEARWEASMRGRLRMWVKKTVGI